MVVVARRNEVVRVAKEGGLLVLVLRLELLMVEAGHCGLCVCVGVCMSKQRGKWKWK